MFSNKLLNISEFARLSGVSRQTLIYYDRIGLFSPVLVADNKYRMYSHNQVDNLGIITILGDLGVPLKKIKEIITDISVERMSNTLEYQLNAIRDKIDKLNLLKDMTELRLEQLKEGANADECCFYIKELAETPICIGNAINCNQDAIGDEEVIDFFDKIDSLGIPLIFTFGYIKELEGILQGRHMVSHMWFKMKNEKYANSSIPSGKYIIGYGKGGYGNTGYINDKLLEYAKNNGYTLTGSIYEEYLVDELSEKNPDEFVIKVIVKIKE